MYGTSEKSLENDVIGIHPFEWQKQADILHPEQYVLTNWKEITKEEYNIFNK
jgi:hypothetical protein